MTRNPDQSERFVVDSAQMELFLDQAAPAPRVGIDTEFLRVNTYYPRLCLMQMSLPQGEIACIDPLQVETPRLKAGLENLSGTMVIHAAGQDLEVLKESVNFTPAKLFDTQIAAALLGRGEQLSYAALALSLLGIELAKGQTRTDWCRRPLSTAQLEYAFNDVKYLIDIQDILLENLDRDGKLEWLDRACEELLEQARRDPGSDTLGRFKAGASVPVDRQGLLRDLVLWRESRARGANRPREWVVSSNDLVCIARAAPENLGGLRACSELNPGQLRHYGGELLDVIARAEPTSAALWRPRSELSSAQRAEIKKMQARVRAFCEERSINASAVVARNDLESLLLGRPGRLDSGWRRELLGEVLDELV